MAFLSMFRNDRCYAAGVSLKPLYMQQLGRDLNGKCLHL